MLARLAAVGQEFRIVAAGFLQGIGKHWHVAEPTLLVDGLCYGLYAALRRRPSLFQGRALARLCPHRRARGAASSINSVGRRVATRRPTPQRGTGVYHSP